MLTPTITLITPCLNPGERLDRCIDSVRKQKYPSLQHIIIDGASTDGTEDRLRHLDVEYVSEPDTGQSNAINKGLRLARGDLVGWLNADDWLETGAIHALAAAAMKHPAAGLFYGDVLYETSVGTLRRRAGCFDLPSLSRNNPIPQPGSLCSRDAWDAVGDLAEDLHLTMDLHLWLRLWDAKVGAVRLRRPLAHFEVHEASKTGSVSTWEWLLEEAAARAGVGWRRSALFTLGRAAAHAPVADGEIKHAVGRTMEHAPQLLSPIGSTEKADIYAGAAAETLVLGRGVSDRLRRLMSWPLWRSAFARATVWEVLGSGVRSCLTLRPGR